MDNAKSLARTQETGNGYAVSVEHVVSEYQKLASVSVVLGAKPGNGTQPVEIKVVNGVDVLYVKIPGTEAGMSILWYPDKNTVLYAGDTVTVLYTNHHFRTYGVTITMIEEENYGN